MNKKRLVVVLLLCCIFNVLSALTQKELDKVMLAATKDFLHHPAYFELRNRYIQQCEPSLQVLEGHTSPIFFLCITKDNKRIISESSDNTARIWELEEGRGSHVMRSPKLQKRAVDLSEDGTLMATGFNKSSVCLWDVITGESIRKLSGSSGLIFAIALSEDGKYVAAGGEKKIIYVWQILGQDFEVAINKLSKIHKKIIAAIFAQEKVYCMCKHNTFSHTYKRLPLLLRNLIGEKVVFECNEDCPEAKKDMLAIS